MIRQPTRGTRLPTIDRPGTDPRDPAPDPTPVTPDPTPDPAPTNPTPDPPEETTPTTPPDVFPTLPAPGAPGVDPSGPQDGPEKDKPEKEKPPPNFEGPLPGPTGDPGTGGSPGGGTPTTSPVVPGRDFEIQPISPGDLPIYTPDEPDQDTRTGRTAEDAKNANKQDKSATEDVADEVIQTDVEAKETGASETPWYDPFGWFTSDGGSGGADSPAVGLLALGAAAVAVYFASTQ